MNAAITRKQRKDEKQEQAWLLHVAPSKTTIISDVCWIWEAHTSGQADEPRKCWWVMVKPAGYAAQSVCFSVDRETALAVGRAFAERLKAGESLERIRDHFYSAKDVAQFLNGNAEADQ